MVYDEHVPIIRKFVNFIDLDWTIVVVEK